MFETVLNDYKQLHSIAGKLHTFYYYVVYLRYALKLPRIEFVEVYKIARSVYVRVPERILEVLRRVLKL